MVSRARHLRVDGYLVRLSSHFIDGKSIITSILVLSSTSNPFILLVYQTIVYVIHDLCLHPEYIEPIRRELEKSYEEFEHTGYGLPLLDSFIKESARLTPVESSEIVQPHHKNAELLTFP